jgi:hypothetical protein
MRRTPAAWLRSSGRILNGNLSAAVNRRFMSGPDRHNAAGFAKKPRNHWDFARSDDDALTTLLELALTTVATAGASAFPTTEKRPVEPAAPPFKSAACYL